MKTYLKLAALSLAAITALTYSFDAQAGKVVKKLKKRSVIIINEGSNAGISKGATVCFFNKKGDELGCAEVRRVKKKRSYIRVDRGLFKKVRRGFTAEVSGSGGGAGGAMLGIRALVGGSLMLPSSVTGPIYDVENASAGGPFWGPGDTKGTSVFMGGEVEYLPLHIAVGGRFTLMKPTWLVAMDYSTNVDQFVEISQELSAFGLWADYFYPLSFGSITLNVGAGLDIEMSTVTSEAIQYDESQPDVANILVQSESSMTTIGLRVPVRLDYPLGAVTLNLGGAFIMGLSGTPTISGTDTEDSNSADPAAYLEDFAAALDHKPGMGLLGWAGVQMNF